jgi:predicted PurR-regulated permease PerM
MSTFLTILVAVLGFVLTVAAAVGSVAAFKISRNTETVKNYKENAASWKERSETQQVEIGTQSEKIQAQAQLIAELQGQVHTMQEILSGRTDAKELAELFRTGMSELGGSVGNLATSLSTLSQRVDDTLGEMLRRMDNGDQHAT